MGCDFVTGAIRRESLVVPYVMTRGYFSHGAMLLVMIEAIRALDSGG